MERGSIPCALPLRLLGHTGTAVCFHANAQMNGSIRAPAHARENSYIRACARALRGCVRVLCVLLMLFHLGVCALASGRSYSEQQSFSQRTLLSGKVVIELGCGMGLPSIARPLIVGMPCTLYLCLSCSSSRETSVLSNGTP